MKPLRTGMLGCGTFARKHAENILAMPEKFELVAFSDHHPGRADTFAHHYGNASSAVYMDHHDMFAKTQLDLVIITLPPYGHSDEVERAAEQGVHVFIEKPIALTAEHAWRMVEAVEKAGVQSQVGFMFRFGAAIETMKGMIERDETGRLGLMSARYFCNSLHSPWWRKRDRSGGQLVEQVIHMVDLMRYLMGDAASVYSLQNNMFHQEVEDYTVEDVSGTVMGFKNGSIGVIYATNGAIPGRWINDYRVVAQNVTAEFQDANHATFTWTAKPDLPVTVIDSKQDFYRKELLDLLDAIETGGPTRTPVREGARTLELALAATRSAECKQLVFLP